MSIAAEYRSLDGRDNNRRQPTQASAPGLMRRGLEGSSYADGIRRPHDRGNERTISRRLYGLEHVLTDRVRPNINMIAVLFGQFLNHDKEDNYFFGHWIDNNKSFVTPDSPYQFVWVLDPEDPIATFRGQNRLVDGTPCGIPFKPSTGEFVDGVFHPGTLASGYLDLTQVYGPEEETHQALREFSGGRLTAEHYQGEATYRTEFGPIKVAFDVENLPASRATTGLKVDSSFMRLPPGEVVTAGDPRASENIGLTLMQILFFREHNRWAAQLEQANPNWEDEILFQEARRRTIAVWQHLLFDEWLPAVFGVDMTERIGDYRGYDEDADATTSVAFATLGLRFGHSALHPYAPRDREGKFSAHTGHPAMPEDGTLPNVGQVNNAISPLGHIGLAGGTPEHVLRGMLATQAHDVGLVYHTAIHDIAFVSGGTDLFTLDLARGRDNGLPPYHLMRMAYGEFGDEGAWDSEAQADTISEKEKRALIDAGKKLERRTPLETFLRFTARQPANPTADEIAKAEAVREIYRRADSIDPMVGLLAEPHVEGSVVGRTMQNIIAEEMGRTRAGDRFWYENDQFDPDELALIKAVTMKDMLEQHFKLAGVIDAEAFKPVTTGQRP
ncbi:unannotated protein [freshwater metagenome]|uniref:Unannotated protein n=1 Tax=freshwater metagenome TaxID=449393 RepID=A0A6J7ECT6_9ZZZZ|nr:hypothetical protein [Actinomycetota bacterium]